MLKCFIHYFVDAQISTLIIIINYNYIYRFNLYLINYNLYVNIINYKYRFGETYLRLTADIF